jgi:hypothetical protein
VDFYKSDVSARELFASAILLLAPRHIHRILLAYPTLTIIK